MPIDMPRLSSKERADYRETYQDAHYVSSLQMEEITGDALAMLDALDAAEAEIERQRKAFTPVTEAEWDAARAKETEYDTHPCDHHSAAKCFCEGACSCHWVTDADVQRMREAIARKPPVTNEQGPGHLLVGTTEDGHVSIQFTDPDWWVHFTPREAVQVGLKLLCHAEAAEVASRG